MSYIRFTEEEKQLANSVDLELFLRQRGETLEKAGREYKLIYTDGGGKHDSITVNGSAWYDHRNRVGGGAIRFMQHFYGLDFQQAVSELLGKNFTQISRSPPVKAKPAEEVKHEFRLPEANGDMHRVFAYLIKQRYISAEVIAYFAKAHKLYEEKEHHNAVFVGTDEQGVPRQAHKRSTSTYGHGFRQTIAGSDTRYSFSHFGKSDRLYVFEAPIDMLSYLTLHPDNWKLHNYIAMNGVYENAVLTALENHSGIKEIYLCTDNDEGGIDAAERLKDILVDKGYVTISRLYPKNKDFNEDLKELNGAEFLPATPYSRKEKYYENVRSLQYFKCDPKQLVDRLSKTFSNNQYRYLAEYAISGSAFFAGGENKMFRNMQAKLMKEYRAYTDKGRMCAKQSDLKTAYRCAVNDLKNNTARTREQSVQTAKMLFELADMAVRCETEQQMSAVQISETPAEQEDVCHSHSLSL